MDVFLWIILSTILISAVSFTGALILFLKEKTLNNVFLFLVAFSAGALMGAAFFDLLPGALEKSGGRSSSEIFLFLIFGFAAFFILEQFIGWHHHHASSHPEDKPLPYMILFSDGLHNFIDGVIIAGAFISGFPSGLAAVLAIILHEIPQEIGDFSVLIYSGWKKARALFWNFLSACFSILGGVLGFWFFGEMEKGILFLLPFAAGAFIYISASDLIPQIKEEKNLRRSLVGFLFFLGGLSLIRALTGVLAS